MILYSFFLIILVHNLKLTYRSYYLSYYAYIQMDYLYYFQHLHLLMLLLSLHGYCLNCFFFNLSIFFINIFNEFLFSQQFLLLRFFGIFSKQTLLIFIIFCLTLEYSILLNLKVNSITVGMINKDKKDLYFCL